jgi:hypothetical protein
VRRAGGEHRAGDQGDVLVGPARVLGRDDVGAEERRLRGDLGGQPQAARLVLDRQPVPALDLHGGRALPPHLGEQADQPVPQLGVGRPPGGGDGGADPAAVVAGTRHPGLELGRPVAGEDQVGMAVDEAGDHRPAADVDAVVGLGCVRRGPDPDDGPVLDDEGGVRHDAQRTVAP